MIAILIGFAILTVWGAIAPRGQWRVLAGWSRRHPYASEPGPVSVGIHRFVAIVATVALGFGGYALYQRYESGLPKPSRQISAVRQMWGAPDPLVVDRVIDSEPVPTDLVAQPILRYQALDGSHRSPVYLFELRAWKPTGALARGGLVGRDPSPGLSALDTAELVVQVRGDKNCIPRSVYTVETSSTITVAVYYGRPDAAGGALPANLADCRPAAHDSDSVSVLLPVRLQDSLGKRKVVNLDGSSIDAAQDPNR